MQTVTCSQNTNNPYHPQSDGLVERFNRTMLSMMGNMKTRTGPDQRSIFRVRLAVLYKLISCKYLEGYSKLQNPVILEYCSKFKGHEIWKDILYFPQWYTNIMSCFTRSAKVRGILEEVVANRPGRGVDGRLFYGGRYVLN